MTPRAPLVRAAFDMLPGELVIDSFAGGGGASTGIEAAIGRPVDIAINHSAEAIAMHRVNHPSTRHYCEDIFTVDPQEACGGRPVGLAWFSPDCCHFSRAKGTKPRDGVVGHGVDRTLGTVTARDHHAVSAATLARTDGQRVEDVRALLIKYYGADGHSQTQDLFEPLHTVTTRARFGLVMVHGEAYQIVDIGMRMLQPHELFAAQGFPDDYEIAPDFRGKPLTKTAQTMLAGNSVCPQVAAALVRENVRHARPEAA